MNVAMDDPYHLKRFVDAQAPVYRHVCAELRGGRKTGHWMWFIFPQIRGLGSSEMALTYGISSREEAIAYLAHPILGARLRECARLVVDVDGKSIDEILGFPDNMKFQSSMTLFAYVTQQNEVFLEALQKYFGGAFDSQTIARL